MRTCLQTSAYLELQGSAGINKEDTISWRVHEQLYFTFEM